MDSVGVQRGIVLRSRTKTLVDSVLVRFLVLCLRSRSSVLLLLLLFSGSGMKYCPLLFIVVSFVQGFDICWMNIRHLFVSLLFCYDFRKLY